MTLLRTTALSAGMIFCSLASLAHADGLAQPKGDVILTVSGAIENTNVGETAQFDLEMLKAIETVSVETSTIWTEGKQTFAGVSLKALMEAVGAKADALSATAINDYAISIPREDWIEGGAVVAYEQNGAVMSVRDKGPLWVIYPYDDVSAYQSEVIYSRSIWQLDRITVGE